MPKRTGVVLALAFLLAPAPPLTAGIITTYDIPFYDEGTTYGGFAFGTDALYVVARDPATDRSRLLVIDSATGKSRTEIDLYGKSGRDFRAVDVRVDGDSVWVASSNRFYEFSAGDFSYRGKLSPDVQEGIQGFERHGSIFLFVEYRVPVIKSFDPATGITAEWARLPDPCSPRGIRFHAGKLLVTDSLHWIAWALAPESRAVEFEIPLAYRSAYALATRGELLYLRKNKGARISPFEYERLPSGRVIADPADATIRYAFSLHNGSSTALVDTELVVPLPKTDERQKVSVPDFGTCKVERTKDRYGQELAVFRVARIEPGESIELGYGVTARLWALRPFVSPETRMEFRAPPEAERTTAIDPSLDYLSATSPGVIELARSVSGGRASPRRFMRETRDSVFRLLSYRLDERRETAAAILESGVGSCTEYSFVTAAVYALNGYAVRFSGGSGAFGWNGGEYVDDTFHRWIEVWMEGCGWVPVDCNRNDGGDPPWSDEYVPGVDRNALVLARGGGGDRDYLGINNTYVFSYGRAVRGTDTSGVESASRFIWTFAE
ncbi:MAG: hypothetical protein NT080_06755 [Spirochaetes bacterium]|nr:hypothetical protein [Spirochaetota bacterium]